MTVTSDKIPENFVAGLEGVVAFTTEIAEPDQDGGALRYLGVDIEDLVSQHPPFGGCRALPGGRKFAPPPPPARAVPAADPQRRRTGRRTGRPGDAGADLG